LKEKTFFIDQICFTFLGKKCEGGSKSDAAFSESEIQNFRKPIQKYRNPLWSSSSLILGIELTDSRVEFKEFQKISGITKTKNEKIYITLD
jgi:hypothetical protein